MTRGDASPELMSTALDSVPSLAENICPVCAALNLPFFPDKFSTFFGIFSFQLWSFLHLQGSNTPLANLVDPDHSSYIDLLTCPALLCRNIDNYKIRTARNICCTVCCSARKPARECDCGAKWDWSVNDLGGTARKAQRGAAGLHGGIQNPRCTAGESANH